MKEYSFKIKVDKKLPKALKAFKPAPPLSIREVIELFKEGNYNLAEVTLTKPDGEKYTLEEINSMLNN